MQVCNQNPFKEYCLSNSFYGQIRTPCSISPWEKRFVGRSIDRRLKKNQKWKIQIGNLSVFCEARIVTIEATPWPIVILVNRGFDPESKLVNSSVNKTISNRAVLLGYDSSKLLKLVKKGEYFDPLWLHMLNAKIYTDILAKYHITVQQNS